MQSRAGFAYFSFRTPLCWLELPFIICPVLVLRLYQVLPRLNSLRAFTAPTRCPRPVFLAMDIFLRRLTFSRPQHVVEAGPILFSTIPRAMLFPALLA